MKKHIPDESRPNLEDVTCDVAELHNALAVAREKPRYAMALAAACADPNNQSPLVATVRRMMETSNAATANYLRECNLLPPKQAN